jgi:hypothetical protein
MIDLLVVLEPSGSVGIKGSRGINVGSGYNKKMLEKALNNSLR